MSPALSRGVKKGLRTILQLAAGGALTAAVNVLAGGMPPNTKVLVLTAWTVLITFAQNAAETKGIVPTLLPSTGLVTTAAGAVVATTVATVDAVTETVGDVTGVVGDVVDTAGQVVGSVTAPVGGLLEGILDDEKEKEAEK